MAFLSGYHPARLTAAGQPHTTSCIRLLGEGRGPTAPRCLLRCQAWGEQSAAAFPASLPAVGTTRGSRAEHGSAAEQTRSASRSPRGPRGLSSRGSFFLSAIQNSVNRLASIPAIWSAQGGADLPSPFSGQKNTTGASPTPGRPIERMQPHHRSSRALRSALTLVSDDPQPGGLPLQHRRRGAPPSLPAPGAPRRALEVTTASSRSSTWGRKAERGPDRDKKNQKPRPELLLWKGDKTQRQATPTAQRTRSGPVERRRTTTRRCTLRPRTHGRGPSSSEVPAAREAIAKLPGIPAQPTAGPTGRCSASPRRSRAGPLNLCRSSAPNGHAPPQRLGSGPRIPANRSIKAPATRSRRLPAYPPSPSHVEPRNLPGRTALPPAPLQAPSPPPERHVGPTQRRALPARAAAGRVPPPPAPPAAIRAEGPRLPFGAGAAGGAGCGTASVLAPRARSAPRVAAAPVRPGTYRPERKARPDGGRGAPAPRFGPRGSAGSDVRGPWRRCFARHQPARLCALWLRRFPHLPERFWLSPA